MSTEELLALIAPDLLVQTWDGKFRAYPAGVDRNEALRDDLWFRESPALLEIRAIDSSLFTVATHDPSHIEALRRRFATVEDEDPDNY